MLNEQLEDKDDSLLVLVVSAVCWSINKMFVLMFNKNNFYKSPTYKIIDVKNIVGTGDCFMAGLIYGMHHHHSAEEIINFAAAAAKRCRWHHGHR